MPDWVARAHAGGEGESGTSMDGGRRPKLTSWISNQAALLLPGALVALALTLPPWRYYRVWSGGSTDIFFELRSAFLYLSDVPALIAIGAWLLTPFWRRTRDLPRWLVGGLALLAALATLSSLWAPMPALALFQGARLWLLFALFLVVATTPGAHSPLAWGVVVSGAIEAGIALAQFRLQRSLGLGELGEVAVRPGVSGTSIITVDGAPILRAYGLTQHPNLLGGILAVFVLVGVGLALSRQGEGRGRASQILAITLTAVCFGGMLLTFSRSAWLGVAAGGAVVTVLALRRGFRGQISWRAAGALLAVVVIPSALFAATQWRLLRPRLGLSVEGVEIRSADERTGLEGGAWMLIREHPWLGVGYGNFSIALWERRPAALEAYPIYQPVHRVPLLATAELGLPGGLIWLVLALGPWVTLGLQGMRWPSSHFPPGLAIGIMGAIASLTVISWFDFYPWFSQQGRLLAWLCWGMFAASAARPRIASGSREFAEAVP
jgi:O-antigen ligase